MSTSLHSLRGHDLLHTGLLRGRYDLMIVTQLRPVTCNEAAPTVNATLSLQSGCMALYRQRVLTYLLACRVFPDLI